VAADEADVGQVDVGQQALFTVDAYPDKNFPAEITELHFASQTVELRNGSCWPVAGIVTT